MSGSEIGTGRTRGTDDGEGEGGRTPPLALDGYQGSLEGLLTLARSRRIDLRKIPLLDLVDQLELAKQGDVAIAREDGFTAIHVSPAPGVPPV